MNDVLYPSQEYADFTNDFWDLDNDNRKLNSNLLENQIKLDRTGRLTNTAFAVPGLLMAGLYAGKKTKNPNIIGGLSLAGGLGTSLLGHNAITKKLDQKKVDDSIANFQPKIKDLEQRRENLFNKAKHFLESDKHNEVKGELAFYMNNLNKREELNPENHPIFKSNIRTNLIDAVNSLNQK